MQSITDIVTIDYTNDTPGCILCHIPRGQPEGKESDMLGIGRKFPEFKLTGVVSNDVQNAFKDVSNETYAGKWLVLFFWPKDFTFVCPTEIAGFGRLNREFADRDTQLLGVSTDSEFVHLAWRKSHEDLRGLPFPMLSDIKRELADGARHPGPGSGCRPARDLHRGSRGRGALRVRDRPQRRPQPRGSAAGARRPADGRAVPLQLAEG